MNARELLSRTKAVLFDIDGTLIDSMPVWDDLGARYLISIGVTPEADLGKILYPMTIEEGVGYLKSHYHLPQEPSEIRAGLMNLFARFYREEVPLKEGVAGTLKKLSALRIPMVLTTIGEPELEEAALCRLGVRQFFLHMYVCSDYQTSKKESRIYEIAASDLKLEPGNCLVVEDVLQAIRAANRAGFLTVAVEDAASLADRNSLMAEADLYVRRLSELPVPEADG